MKTFTLLPLAFATLAYAQSYQWVALRSRPIAPANQTQSCNTTGNGRDSNGLLLSKCRVPLVRLGAPVVTLVSRRDLSEAAYTMEDFAANEAQIDDSSVIEETSEDDEESAQVVDDSVTSEHAGDNETEDDEEEQDEEIEGDALTDPLFEEEDEVPVKENASTPACQTYRLSFPAECCPTTYLKLRARRSVAADDEAMVACDESTVHIQHSCPLPAFRMADQIMQKVKLDLYSDLSKLKSYSSIVVDCGAAGEHTY